MTGWSGLSQADPTAPEFEAEFAIATNTLHRLVKTPIITHHDDHPTGPSFEVLLLSAPLCGKNNTLLSLRQQTKATPIQ